MYAIRSYYEPLKMYYLAGFARYLKSCKHNMSLKISNMETMKKASSIYAIILVVKSCSPLQRTICQL